MEDENLQMDLADFVERIVSIVGRIESRLISVERTVAEVRIEHDCELKRLTLCLKIQQDELEKLHEMNNLAFSKIADVLAQLGVDRATIKAAFPKSPELN